MDVAAKTNAKAVGLSGMVTLGPESAAKHGLPVGTQIDLGTLAYWHKNPIVRFWRRHTTHRRRRTCLSE